MAEFSMKIAGQVGRIRTAFDSTREYCRPYLTEDAPDFFAEITATDREFEQEASWDEARQEGIRPRTYTEPHLERAALQRKFAEHLFRHDTLLFHGSLVAVDGAGYLFTAKSGTGKSTHTRLWCQAFGNRAVMVNDDKPFLQITASGILAHGSPWCGKHGLHANMTVPLKGICILERGEENRIHQISPSEAMPMLLWQGYAPVDAALFSQRQMLLEALAQKTPLWHMACTKDPQAALVAYEAMSK